MDLSFLAEQKLHQCFNNEGLDLKRMESSVPYEFKPKELKGWVAVAAAMNGFELKVLFKSTGEYMVIFADFESPNDFKLYEKGVLGG